MTAFLTISGLCAANFIWQAISDQAWSVALDRSFFQAAAVLTYMAASYVLNMGR